AAVVIKGIIDVLQRHHPAAKPEPQKGRSQVNTRNKTQHQQQQIAWQQIAQLGHFPAQRTPHQRRNGFFRQNYPTAALYPLTQQAIERAGQNNQHRTEKVHQQQQQRNNG